MTTVALVGADGAGKTTIARMLPEACATPVKYLYMGPNIESSNVALPTSRLILLFKLRSYARTARRKGITDPNFVSTHHNAHRKVKRGKIGSSMRMFNRLAEACFRQIVSWIYQLRGFTVVYDRHFLFDAATSDENKYRKPTDRVYYWLLAHVFPQPELVLFLDAPPELLFARKGEGSVEYLQRKREVCMAQGAKMRNFITVDASQAPEKVLAEVSRHISSFQAGKRTHGEVHSHEA